MGVNTLNGYFYKPTLSASGTTEMNLFHAKLDIADAEIKLNKDTIAAKADLDSPTFITKITVAMVEVDVISSPTAESIEVKPDGDTDDFFTFKSLQDRPTIKREGGKFIYFESSNVYDVGISFRADDTYSGTLNYEKDNHMMTVVGKNSPFGFKANSDYVNYIKFQTASSMPEITVVASNGLKINAGGTNSLLLNHSGGSIGIGTVSPSGTLDINVITDADAHFLLSENDVTKWDIYNDHLDDALQIKAGSTLVAELDISGNLDIKSGALYKIGGVTYLGNVEDLKVKLDGTAAPTVNDDVDLGYAVGSRWFDITNDKEYVCLDNTDGAAVWTETTGAGGGASTFVDLTDTPANFTSKAGKTLKVNSTPNAVEFTNDTNVTTKTTTATLTTAEQGTILVSAASAYTITLPTPVGNLGLTYKIKKTDFNYNLITIAATAGQFNYENTDSALKNTYPRLNTGGAEVTFISDNSNWQVKDEAMGQVPICYAYPDATLADIRHGLNYIELYSELYDIGNNFDSSTWVSGNATSTSANHLVDSGGAFTSNMVGHRVKNTTDTTYTYITVYNSATDVTVRDNIFVDTEGYEIKYSKYIIPVPGKYEIKAQTWNEGSTTVADKFYAARIYVNDVLTSYKGSQSSIVSQIAPYINTIQSYSVDDKVELATYNTPDVETVDIRANSWATYFYIKLILKD